MSSRRISRPQLKLACNRIDPLEQEYVATLARSHGVDVQILTNLTAGQLAVQYNSARLCVYAPVMEPFGLVPLEAMACGWAVVGVRDASVCESIVHEKTGILVDRDPAEFSQAIKYLLDNPDLAAENGRNGREYVLSKWTWDQSAARLEGYFDPVIDTQ